MTKMFNNKTCHKRNIFQNPKLTTSRGQESNVSNVNLLKQRALKIMFSTKSKCDPINLSCTQELGANNGNAIIQNEQDARAKHRPRNITISEPYQCDSISASCTQELKSNNGNAIIQNGQDARAKHRARKITISSKSQCDSISASNTQELNANNGNAIIQNEQDARAKYRARKKTVSEPYQYDSFRASCTQELNANNGNAIIRNEQDARAKYRARKITVSEPYQYDSFSSCRQELNADNGNAIIQNEQDARAKSRARKIMISQKSQCESDTAPCTQELGAKKEETISKNEQDTCIKYGDLNITDLPSKDLFQKSSDLIQELKTRLNKINKINKLNVLKPKRTTSIPSNLIHDELDSLIGELIVDEDMFDGKSLRGYIQQLINDKKVNSIKNSIDNLMRDIDNTCIRIINSNDNNHNNQQSNRINYTLNRGNQSSNLSAFEITDSLVKTNRINSSRLSDKFQLEPNSPTKSSNVSDFYSDYLKIGKCSKLLVSLRRDDEIIHAYCQPHDFRIIQIAKMYNVKIHFFGPYKSIRNVDTVVVYHCLISSLKMVNLEKCLKTIKSTFPTTHPKILEIVK